MLGKWIEWSIREENRKKWLLHPQLVIPMAVMFVGFTLMAVL